MTNHNILECLDSIIRLQPTPRALLWLAEGFRRNIETEGEPLSVSLGIAEQHPSGLRVAVRRHQFRKEIFRALALIDDPSRSVRSVAVELASELKRLSRRHASRPPTNALEASLLAALDAHPGAGISVTQLWQLVNEYRIAVRSDR